MLLGLFKNQIHTISTVMMQFLSMKTKKIHIKKATLESLNSEVEWQHISSRQIDGPSYWKVIKHILVPYVLVATIHNTARLYYGRHQITVCPSQQKR